MEILNQITRLVSNPPQGSGNLRRLRKRFEKVTARTQGFMDFNAFSEAIRYPLKIEVQEKLFEKYFNAGSKDKRGLRYDRFLSILRELDKRTRAERIDDILGFYSDQNEMVSFEDFENVISVALQQIDFQIGEVERHRLVETILKTRRGPGQPAKYHVASIKDIIRQWNSLDKRIGDILYLALFLKPKVPLDTTKHNNRVPSVFRPRSSTSKSFFVSVLALYGVAVALLTAAVWAYTHTTSVADENVCEKIHFEAYKSKLIKLNKTHAIPALSDGTFAFETADSGILRTPGSGSVEALEPENIDRIACKSVVTELLNFHLLFVSLLTLKSMKVALCRKPFCAYLNREDVRLVLWIVAFSIGVLCVVEFVLISFHEPGNGVVATYLTSTRFLINNRTLNQIASGIKIVMIASTLLLRLPFVRDRLVHYAVDVGEFNLNVFIAIHLLQDESFLKWAVPLIVSYVFDSYSFERVEEATRSFDTNFISTSGGLVMSTDRRNLKFRLGDVYFLIVEQVAVGSIVPAWVISSPSDESRLKLLLHEGHWQTKVFRRLLKNIRIKNQSLSPSRPAGVRCEQNCVNPRHKELNSASLRRLGPRNYVIMSNDSDSDSALERWQHLTSLHMTTSLQVRLKGPFRSVHFELYTKYDSVMLLITPKSAGAVLAYLLQHSDTGSRQKVVMFFAATEFRRVEWFIASLVQLELREMERHLEHSDRRRLECDECRMFFRLYLTSATSGQDARIMWVQLAMAVLAGDKNPDLVENLQRSLYPDMNVVSLDTELFNGLEFVLCDADFPYADAFLAQSGSAQKEVRHF